MITFDTRSDCRRTSGSGRRITFPKSPGPRPGRRCGGRDLWGTVLRSGRATSIAFEPEIAPAGWTVPGYDQERWGFDDLVDEFADCEPTRDSLDRINDRHTLTFKKAGTYSSTYVIVSDRVSVGREVTFHIRECPEWEFVLPEETVEIGAFAFQNIAAESVRISSRCNKIGEGAFDGSQAKYFYVPASVTEIGENAFPEGACLYTTAGSPAAAWAGGRPYRVIILGE